MANVAVVTDSTADLPRDVAASLGIEVVPLNLHFGDQTYRDGVDMTASEFYRRLVTSAVFPKTSQPSAGLFEETYRRLGQTHDGVVSMHISSKLSGTFNSATLARQAIGEGLPIEVIDTRLASMSLGYVAMAAARAARAGASAADVAAAARALLGRVHLLLVVDTLEFLQRGGRIGRAQALVGSLLSVKPVLGLEDGEVKPVERVRTRARALEKLVEFATGFNHVAEMAILHSTSAPDVETLIERLAAKVPRERVIVGEYGPVIGAHLGPGAIGIFVNEGPG